MAGDEIVAEWLGDVYSRTVSLSTTVVTRFNATSLRYRTFHIYNDHPSEYADIGQYFSNTGAFHTNSIFLGPGDSIKLNFVDLYELAHFAPNNALNLQVLGINKY